ncbi:hypothetical protein Cni_G26282 [Canna indica]|uniref:Uncharacterized protein n=1 Tax=Canna indica TaxID=4628 RepID=A0AAQ3QR60_9LILI|nr:hypothetical protein Cni_G26282 [Canna indica]
MRPATASMPSSSSSSSVPNVWHTPVPYLFVGFGTVMILIAAALVTLACSHWRSVRSRPDPESPSFSEKPVIVHLDMEPRLVVIMAGDDKPSFIAKPFSLVQDAQEKPVQQSFVSQEPSCT